MFVPTPLPVCLGILFTPLPPPPPLPPPKARDRLRRTAEESLAQARERLRAQDAQILEYCRRIVSRYRRGEYVAEDELEFAFDQLEKRLL